MAMYAMAVISMFAALVSMAFLLHSAFTRWYYMTFAFAAEAALCIAVCMILLGM